MHKITTAVIEMEKKKMEKDVNKLQAVRKAAGLTQQQLAEKSGVSYSLICKVESGERSINLVGASRLTNLCEVLGCQIRDIVTDQRIIDWDENTPPIFKRMQIVAEQAEIEMIAERMQRVQDIKNGVVREKPKRVEPVKKTGIKVRKIIPIELEFDTAFIPPEEFSDRNDSMCYLCPFSDEDWEDYDEWDDCGEGGLYCRFTENVDDKCHLGKYFKED